MAEKFPRIRTVGYVGYLVKNLEKVLVHGGKTHPYFDEKAKTMDFNKEKIWR